MADLMLRRRLKSGEHAALKEIYDQNIKNLENYALKFCKDTTLIEDTLHDVFIQIWHERDSLSDTDSIIRYLCVVLRRELIKRLNKSQITSSYEQIAQKDIDFTLNIEDTITQGGTDNHHNNKLQKGLSLLCNRQREAIFFKIL